MVRSKLLGNPLRRAAFRVVQVCSSLKPVSDKRLNCDAKAIMQKVVPDTSDMLDARLKTAKDLGAVSEAFAAVSGIQETRFVREAYFRASRLSFRRALRRAGVNDAVAKREAIAGADKMFLRLWNAREFGDAESERLDYQRQLSELVGSLRARRVARHFVRDFSRVMPRLLDRFGFKVE
ncbi:MAG: hypothetical protein AABW54_05140 [Candidatus Micrarchaeota archaeon]